MVLFQGVSFSIRDGVTIRMSKRPFVRNPTVVPVPKTRQETRKSERGPLGARPKKLNGQTIHATLPREEEGWKGVGWGKGGGAGNGESKQECKSYFLRT